MSKTTALVLFDLDGTLVDTAPDLAAAANRMRQRRGLPPLALAQLRSAASQGAIGMLRAAFGLSPDAPELADLRTEFLDEYAAALCVHSRLFPGMEEVLATLAARQLPWGIVTNKMARFTDPLLEALGLASQAACVVSADTTAYAKPHPEPVRHALALCQVAPAHACLVGDDERDIQAGRAAGVRTIGAGFGYLGCETPPERWGADAWIDSPQALLKLI